MRRWETKRKHRRRTRQQRIHQRSVARRVEHILTSADRISSEHDVRRLGIADRLNPVIREIEDPTAQELLFNAARHAGARRRTRAVGRHLPRAA